VFTSNPPFGSHRAASICPVVGGCGVRVPRRFAYGLVGCGVTIIADLNRSAIMLRTQARARSRRLYAGWLGRSSKVTLPQCRHPADTATARPSGVEPLGLSRGESRTRDAPSTSVGAPWHEHDGDPGSGVPQDPGPDSPRSALSPPEAALGRICLLPWELCAGGMITVSREAAQEPAPGKPDYAERVNSV